MSLINYDQSMNRASTICFPLKETQHTRTFHNFAISSLNVTTDLHIVSIGKIERRSTYYATFLATVARTGNMDGSLIVRCRLEAGVDGERKEAASA